MSKKYTSNFYLKVLIYILLGYFFVGCVSSSKKQNNSQISEESTDMSETFGTATPLSEDEERPFAKAILNPASGSAAQGDVTFTKLNSSLRIHVKVKGVYPSGNHGIHIHEYGDCITAKDASSAGEHFNPTNHLHGIPNSSSAHIGDLGNIEVDQNGNGELILVLHGSAYDEESIGGWDAIIGKSVIVHEQEDDFITQPSGDSGNRIACGVIESLQ